MMMAQTDPTYQAHAAMAGFAPETPDQHGAALAKAHSVAQLAANVAEADKRMEAHVGRILKGDRAPPAAGGGKDFGSKGLRKAATEAHDERSDEVLALAGNPEAMMERLAANLGNVGSVAPAIAASISATAARGVQYLAKVAQRPAQQGPLAPKWEPNEAEKSKFARAYHAVTDPESVLNHLAAGTATPEEVGALKEVWPALHSDLVNKTLTRLTDTKREVPYRQRLMLSMLLGASADGSSSGKAIAANQPSINAAAKTQGTNMDAPLPASKASAVHVANRMATPQDRRDMKES
jgi:hypothetical protein